MGTRNRRKGALASLVIVVVLVMTLAMPVAAQSNEVGWRGEYFANRYLWGHPQVVRIDAQIGFDWGTGSPAPGIPADNFSVRWMRYAYFQGGTYRFTTVTDDGVRLYVDGRLIVDQWRDMAPTAFTADVHLTGGFHTVRMEYYEAGGGAVARLSWTRLSAPDRVVSSDDRPSSKPSSDGTVVEPPVVPPMPMPPAQPMPMPTLPAQPMPMPTPPTPPITAWRGEYYNNTTLSGTPALIRNDERIDFDWGTGSPDPRIRADNFSARWTRDMRFQAGRYRFTIEADDGVRLYIDGALIVDEWRGGRKSIVREIPLGEGTHSFRVEYYEATGYALAKLSWEGPLGPLVGNLITWVPPYPSYSWVKVYRWDGGNWVDTNPRGYSSFGPTGYLKIDGLLVAWEYRATGHPYWVELWIDGRLVRSVGNFQRGEPAFRIWPNVDNYTPW
ncbi:MAG: PA14 domain-containing protein [Anaerolineae bacterium]